jgi:hypothetical protein
MNGTPVAIAQSGLDVARICPWQPRDSPEYPFGLFCVEYANPGYGYGSFDNILFAWLSLFQVRTSGCKLMQPTSKAMHTCMYHASPGQRYLWVVFGLSVQGCLVHQMLTKDTHAMCRYAGHDSN